MDKRWVVPHPDMALQKKLSKEFEIPPITAQVLINRGLRNSSEVDLFLNGKLSQLHDPFIFSEMKAAVDRIFKAIKGKEKIVMYGDYDVDGSTGTALLCYLMKDLEAKYDYYVPNRLEEGYGLHKAALDTCKKEGAKVLITIDNGVGAIAEIAYAKKIGIDVIVTDHHEPKEELPDCVAILDPKLPDEKYPFKGLSGVGMAFKLAHALVRRGLEINYPPAKKIDLKEHLDLVALGTVADVVPLIDENRIMVKHGLKKLSRATKVGLKVLKEKSGLTGEISTGQVAFRLAPRLNAAGRIGDARNAIKLMTTEDEDEAINLAHLLEESNRERQEIERKILEEAMKQVKSRVDLEKDPVIVLDGENWHSGVIGIVASRILGTYYKPTIIISVDGNQGKGSARSVKNLHILEALTECGGMLKSFGGHKQAAGFSLEKKTVEQFRVKFAESVRHRIKPEDLIPELEIDMEVKLGEISFDLLDSLELLSPFGYENPRPILASRNLEVIRPSLVGKNHLKLLLSDGKDTLDAIGFDMADALKLIRKGGTKVDVAYRPQINTFRGNTALQLQIEDIRLSSESATL